MDRKRKLEADHYERFNKHIKIEAQQEVTFTINQVISMIQKVSKELEQELREQHERELVEQREEYERYIDTMIKQQLQHSEHNYFS
jgi:DNA-binding transcriptional MerR regulator